MASNVVSIDAGAALLAAAVWWARSDVSGPLERAASSASELERALDTTAAVTPKAGPAPESSARANVA